MVSVAASMAGRRYRLFEIKGPHLIAYRYAVNLLKHPENRFGVGSQQFVIIVSVKKGAVGISDFISRPHKGSRMLRIPLDHRGPARKNMDSQKIAAFRGSQHISFPKAPCQNPVTQTQTEFFSAPAYFPVKLFMQLIPFSLHLIHRTAGQILIFNISCNRFIYHI